MKHLKIIGLLMLALMLVVGAAYAETSRLGSSTYTFNPTKSVTKTADYTLLVTDSQVKFNVTAASRTATLPAVSDAMAGGRVAYKIIKTDATANTVTITAASGDTVGGESSRKLISQNAYIVIHAGPGRDWTVDYESSYFGEDHGAGTTTVSTATGFDSQVVFEGSTADAYETTVAVTDPTADITYQFPDAPAGTFYPVVSTLSTNAVDAANAVTGTSNGVKFEGATADDYETTITLTDPTADRTVTIPDATGTVAFTTGLGTTTSVYTAPTVSTTFTTADCGKIVGVATDALTHVLPDSTAGCCMKFTNTGAAGNNVIKIDVDADDQIFGTVTLAASVVVIAGSAGDSISLTKATSIRGDSIELCAVGSNVWNIMSSTGIWADTN